MSPASTPNARAESALQVAAQKLDTLATSAPRLMTANTLAELANAAAALVRSCVDAEAVKIVLATCVAQTRAPDAKAGLIPPGDEVHADGTRTLGLVTERVRGVFRKDGTRVGSIMAVGPTSKQLEGLRDSMLTQISQLCGVAADNLALLQQNARERARGEDILSLVCHDLRLPLHNLALALGLLGECEPRVRESIAFSVAQIAGIVDDVLDSSRLETGALELQRARHSLTAIVERVMRGFAAHATNCGVTLRMEYKHEPILSCDAHRLAQAFTSLLSAALHATAPGGKVLIRIHAQGTLSVVELFDGGPGIEESDRERLFDSDFAVERRDARSRLGLHVAKAIITAHGGLVGCEAVPKGGTKLWVHLR